ncbi:hypothetical protein NUW58_g9783 [Xylaria curta]|uniref:Uncharacterized protein n=1 Tax=Xylaria curta TaxID=42375 RepID=A0ACC1MV63_9PEZI|nr:hypothetical protein NUW58_g9783 [Xylaria curta]
MNHLESRIRIIDRVASDWLIPLHGPNADTVDFVMKSEPPHSACTGAPVEMVCEGGEVRFVERIISESIVLRDRVQWYTAMLGKQSSLEVLVNVLKKHRINNFAVTTFTQGSKTRRWALGWSFLTRRPSLSATRGCGSSISKNMLPPVTAITIYEHSPRAQTDAIHFLRKALCDTIESLDMRSWAWDEQRLRGIGFAEGNVWSRAYRRRRAGEGVTIENKASTPLLDITACTFGFSLTIQQECLDKPSDGPAVILRWLQGDDESLFESFAGVIRRCLRKDTTRPC